jgi:hypothetical protein
MGCGAGDPPNPKKKKKKKLIKIHLYTLTTISYTLQDCNLVKWLERMKANPTQAYSDTVSNGQNMKQKRTKYIKYPENAFKTEKNIHPG